MAVNFKVQTGRFLPQASLRITPVTLFACNNNNNNFIHVSIMEIEPNAVWRLNLARGSTMNITFMEFHTELW